MYRWEEEINGSAVDSSNVADALKASAWSFEKLLSLGVNSLRFDFGIVWKSSKEIYFERHFTLENQMLLIKVVSIIALCLMVSAYFFVQA